METLGIDVGGVIIDRANDKTDTAFFGKNYLKTTPVEGAFGAIAVLNRLMFKGRVHIVSKCGLKIARQTLEWMEHWRFFEETGLDPGRIHFCLKREDKAPMAKSLGLTHFIDDRLEILGHLRGIVAHRYLFQGRKDEIARFKASLDGVIQVGSWEEALSEVGETLVPEEDKVCRCERDEDGNCQKCMTEAAAFVGKLIRLTREIKQVFDNLLAELDHACRACDRRYYDFALAKIIREHFSHAKENWKAELPVLEQAVQHFVNMGRGLGILKFPLSEKAWSEISSGTGH